MWIEPQHLRAKLITHAPQLRQMGVARLAAAGSRVRADWRPDSDLDLVVEFLPDAAVSLLDFSRLQKWLSEVLGVQVDLIDRRSLRSTLRKSIEEDEQPIFEAA